MYDTCRLPMVEMKIQKTRQMIIYLGLVIMKCHKCILERVWSCQEGPNRQLVRTLTLKGSIATKVICFSRLLKCLRSLYDKQSGPRSNCSYRSSLIWVHPVCLLLLICSKRLQQTSFFRYIFFL